MLLKVGLNWRVLKKSLKKKMRKKKKKMRREKMGRTWLVLEKNISHKMLKMKYICDWVRQTLRSQHLPWSVSCWCWWWWGTYGRCTCCRVERGRLRTDSWDEKKKGMSKLCTRSFFRSLTCRWAEVKVTKATKRRRNISLLKTAFDATCSLTDPLTKKVASVVYSSQRCVLGGERNRNQEFWFRFRQCRYRNFWQEKAREFVILWIHLRELLSLSE